MKYLFLILILNSFQISLKAQSFLDSLFFNIPFETSVIETYHFLKNDSLYKLEHIDSIKNDKNDLIDFILYEVNKGLPFRTEASAILYQKNTLTLFWDTICNECPKWESNLILTYESTKKRNANYKKIINAINENMKIIKVDRPKYDKDSIITEFYLSDRKTNNVLSVSYSKRIEKYRIFISYH